MHAVCSDAASEWTMPEVGYDGAPWKCEGMRPVGSEGNDAFPAVSLASPAGAAAGLVVTGRNEAGKSTLLRTLALNTMLAHAGLVVRATRFQFTAVDAVSMRASNSFSLYNDVASFERELREMDRIVRESTPRTLVLVDGFAQTTEAESGGRLYANVVEHLLSSVQCTVVAVTHSEHVAAVARRASSSARELAITREGDGISALQALRDVCASLRDKQPSPPVSSSSSSSSLSSSEESGDEPGEESDDSIATEYEENIDGEDDDNDEGQGE